MSIPADIQRENPSLGDRCILHAWRGSIAHGTFEPSTNEDSVDDKDTMAIWVPSRSCYFGLEEFSKRGTQQIKEGEWDIVAFEARKAIQMLQQGNPNILSMLWLTDSGYIKRTRPGDLLLNERELFVGKWVYQPFVGYALGQLKRLSVSGRPLKEDAYLAGIFDGEGHVCIHRSKPPKPTQNPIFFLEVGITNTDTELIERLLAEHGGHISRTGIRDDHRMDAYRWRLAGPQAAKWLRSMLPYLRIKKRQAEIGIAFQHTVSVRKRGVPLSSDELEQREDFRATLRASRRDKTVAVPEVDGDVDQSRYATAYMGDKRKALVEKHGHDTKNGSHLIRLLRMGIEFLNTGALIVDRSGYDASDLLAIKHGEWSLEQVQEEAQRLFRRAEEAFDRCTLPAQPNHARISGLCEDIVALALEERGELR